MISYYIIPENIRYVEQSSDIEKWPKTDRIDYNIPTVALINDSKFTRLRRFVVIYKGMMQPQGGCASCYNPIISEYRDNSKMPPHMEKWKSFSYDYLLSLVVYTKYELLRKLELDLPTFASSLKDFEVMKGLLIGKLDLIGLGKAPVSILNDNKILRMNRKLLLERNSF